MRAQRLRQVPGCTRTLLRSWGGRSEFYDSIDDPGDRQDLPSREREAVRTFSAALEGFMRTQPSGKLLPAAQAEISKAPEALGFLVPSGRE